MSDEKIINSGEIKINLNDLIINENESIMTGDNSCHNTEEENKNIELLDENVDTLAVGDSLGSGTLTGTSPHSQVYASIYWTQTELSDRYNKSKITCTLRLYTKYNWENYAYSPTLTINGSSATGSTVNCAGTGTRNIYSRSLEISHTADKSIAISGSMRLDGVYAGTSIGTLTVSGTVTLKGPTAMNSCIKTDASTYKPIKDIYIKIDANTYKLVSEVYVKRSATEYTKVT